VLGKKGLVDVPLEQLLVAFGKKEQRF